MLRQRASYRGPAPSPPIHVCLKQASRRTLLRRSHYNRHTRHHSTHILYLGCATSTHRAAEVTHGQAQSNGTQFNPTYVRPFFFSLYSSRYAHKKVLIGQSPHYYLAPLLPVYTQVDPSGVPPYLHTSKLAADQNVQYGLLLIRTITIFY